MGLSSIKKTVLKKIKPSIKEEERELKVAEEIITKLKNTLPKNYKVRLTGSVAKGTFLKNSADLDIFILVPTSVRKDKLFGIVENAAKKAFPKNKSEVKYAEHPYVRLEGFGRRVDLVPAYEITYIEERASAVDRSVLHTGYINGQIKEREKDEVRLLKQFLKMHDLYGAEIKVQGFSGYLCELLILEYGTFFNLLKDAEKWKFPFSIDLEKYYNSEEDVLKRFETKNITVVDPVDKNRDVSSIVSDEVLYRFMVVARSFLKKPSKKFFERRRFDSRKTKAYLKRHANLFSFSFNHPSIVDDILWGQLRKLGKRIVKYLSDLDFTILDYYLHSDGGKITILIESLERELPEKIPILGPKVSDGRNIELFKKAHKSAVLYLNKGRIVAIENRKKTTFENSVKEFFKKERNLPSYLSRNLRKGKLDKKIKKDVLEGYFFWRKVFRE
uniref:CCA-adding enzyme n=1 Tax=uncultured marine group II/III euryarchaeote KM3_195_B08 TaxID=1457970 RepID=A0A075GYA2_9EURY|nr:CCA-adding enzyme (cca) [uncultured marine group II/III euryarchaeote KM3_195_B08]